MRSETKKKIAIGTFVAAIVVECIAALLFLLPMAGFIIYPFVSGAAIILSLICCVFCGEKPVLRIISIIFSFLLVISIIADLIFFMYAMGIFNLKKIP